jgi:hypothetical protein
MIACYLNLSLLTFNEAGRWKSSKAISFYTFEIKTFSKRSSCYKIHESIMSLWPLIWRGLDDMIQVTEYLYKFIFIFSKMEWNECLEACIINIL